MSSVRFETWNAFFWKINISRLLSLQICNFILNDTKKGNYSFDKITISKVRYSALVVFSISISTACIKKTTKSFSMIMNHEESQIQLLLPLAYQIISSLCFIKISFWWFMILKQPWRRNFWSNSYHLTMTINHGHLKGLIICYKL